MAEFTIVNSGDKGLVQAAEVNNVPLAMRAKTIQSNDEVFWREEPSRINVEHLQPLLLHCTLLGASDITIMTRRQVLMEINGRIWRATKRALTHPEVSDLLNVIYGANASTQILSGKDVDTHYEVRRDRLTTFRFRVNGTGCLVNGQDGTQITLRTIPGIPPTLDDLNIPQKLREHLMPPQGIVIISGATGSGKSTLLAAIIRELAEHRQGKILTYEAPIEFSYDDVPQTHSSVSQHEIPRHLPDFPHAIRNALRRKPSYILVGEARDAETITAVIDAALTGHTVYSTVHANGVVDTIRRMVSAFPSSERTGRTIDLMMMMRVLFWQALLPSKDGKRVPLQEWLVFSDQIRDMLLKCKIED